MNNRKDEKFVTFLSFLFGMSKNLLYYMMSIKYKIYSLIDQV